MDYPYEKDIGLIEVDGRIYRRFITEGTARRKGAGSIASNRVLVDVEKMEHEVEADEILNLNIEQDNSGVYSAKIHVPSIFHKFIVGKGGQLKAKLQKETGATIFIPRQGAASEDIGLDISSSSSPPPLCLAHLIALGVSFSNGQL